jgi:hypothetical protein
MIHRPLSQAFLIALSQLMRDKQRALQIQIGHAVSYTPPTGGSRLIRLVSMVFTSLAK